jgi:vancomycin resistance protein YoaR
VFWQNYSKKLQLSVLFSILVLLAGVGVVTADQLILHDQRILPNVHVAYVNIGGLNFKEAKAKLNEAVQSAAKLPVLVTDQIEIWPISPEQIGLAVDVDKSVSASYSIGRGDGFWQRWKDRLSSRDQSLYLPVRIKFDQNKLTHVLEKLSPKIYRQPRDASLLVLFKSKSVALIPAVEGRKLNIGQTVEQALSKPQMQFYVVIDLKFNIQSPKIIDSHYAGINSMLSSYSTPFKSWDYDRNANLRLATQRIHGTILKPGAVFSYNEKVGQRTQQQGFRMAPVILDGKLVPDWGGGVCQVSSTLYNSALLANLDIVDRSNHGRAIGYVPLGFDATVVDGLIDFKFKNNLSKPIMIYSALTENELFFAVLGDASNSPPPIELDYVVHKVIEPKEIKQPDPTLEVGKEIVDESPQRGFKVATYRIRKIDGKQVRQLLAIDDYDPVNKIIKVGAKPKGAASAGPAVSGTVQTTKTPPGGASHGTITLRQPPKPLGNGATSSNR